MVGNYLADRILKLNCNLESESAKVAKQYLPAGYIYMKLSNGKTDNLCAKSTVTAGVPVNTCIVGGASSYKVQLQTGSPFL